MVKMPLIANNSVIEFFYIFVGKGSLHVLYIRGLFLEQYR